MMDDKTKKTLGIGLGIAAIVGLGAGLMAARSKPSGIVSHECNAGYHWDATANACVADVIPVEDWFSEMPELPVGRGVEKLPLGMTRDGFPYGQAVGEKYFGNIDQGLNLGLVFDLYGWIPGFASGAQVDPNSWVRAIAPSGVTTALLKEGDVFGAITREYIVASSGRFWWEGLPQVPARAYQRHLSSLELGGDSFRISESARLATIGAWKASIAADTSYSAATKASMLALLEVSPGLLSPRTWLTPAYLPLDENHTPEEIRNSALNVGKKCFNYREMLPYFILDRIYYGGGWPAGFGGWTEGIGPALSGAPLPYPDGSIEFRFNQERGNILAAACTTLARGQTQPFGDVETDSLIDSQTAHSIGEKIGCYANGGLYIWEFVDDNPLYRTYLSINDQGVYYPPSPFWKLIAAGAWKPEDFYETTD